MPTLADALLPSLILLLAAGVQGFLGFGFGMTAMSSLALCEDLVHAAGVVNLTGLLITASQLWRLRAFVLWRPAGRILPWLLLGVLCGVTALGELDRSLLVRILGASVMAISAWNLLLPRVTARGSPLWDGAVGLLSGALGGAFNTGGPPLVAYLYRRPESPLALKATLQLLFLCIGASRAPAAASQGLMTPPVLRDAALATPFVLAGLAGGLALGARVDGTRFRRISWLALGGLGMALLVTS